MNRLIMLFNGLIIGLSLTLSACSTHSPTTTNQAGNLSKPTVVTVRQGVVTSVKDVAILGKQGRAGGTVGSITGSLLGSSVPYAGSIIGSIVGGAIGSGADRELRKKPGLEITLQLENGENVIVTQLAETKFKTGDKVQLIVEDNVARVAHLQDNS